MDLKLVTEALEFAGKKHTQQRRKGANRIPYINHLLEVLNMLCRNTNNPETKLLVAAILHDTIEDTKTSASEITELFGNDVLEIVTEVTDDMSLPANERKRLQLEKAETLSPEAKQIKIADKACNIKDVLYTRIQWNKKRKIEYILWAQQVVVKCSGVNPELENAFNLILVDAKSKLKF